MSVFTEIGRAIIEDGATQSDDNELTTEAPEDDFTPPDPDELDIGELLYEADMEEPVTPIELSDESPEEVPEVTAPAPKPAPVEKSVSIKMQNAGTGIIGDIQFTSGAIINAPVTGNIKGTNIVINAPVTGNITGKTVTLNSTITGSLMCDNLILTSNGKMEHGTMTTKSVAFQNE